MKITVNQLRKIIREEVEKNISSEQQDPTLNPIHQAFIELKDENDEVNLEVLQKKIGYRIISWNGIQLRNIGGVVSAIPYSPLYDWLKTNR